MNPAWREKGTPAGRRPPVQGETRPVGNRLRRPPEERGGTALPGVPDGARHSPGIPGELGGDDAGTGVQTP